MGQLGSRGWQLQSRRGHTLHVMCLRHVVADQQAEELASESTVAGHQA